MPGQRHRPPSHVQFSNSAVSRDSLDRATAAVASCKIAVSVSAARVRAQLSLHQAHRLEDLCEVNPRQSAEAAERVGGRDALRRFAGMLGPHHFGEWRLQALFDPVLYGRERVLFVLELLGQAGHEVRFESDRLGFHLMEHSLEYFRSPA